MFKGDRVMIPGGESMIGSAVADLLELNGAVVDRCPHSDIDFMWPLTSITKRFVQFEPDYVINCCGYNGGIEFNRNSPAEIYYNTASANLNILAVASFFYPVRKIVSIISSCALPDCGNEVLKQGSLNSGPPNKSVDCHGYSKRVSQQFSEMLNRQFGTRAVCVVLQNSFGPRDRFDPERSKVVGGLIRKFVEAYESGAPSVTLWGSGSPQREFIYCYDAAQAIIQALLWYENVEIPLNIGSRQEVTIRELAEMIAEIVGYTGKIEWDTSRPDGQMRKYLDSEEFFSRPELCVKMTPLRDALESTIEWYKDNKSTWTK